MQEKFDKLIDQYLKDQLSFEEKIKVEMMLDHLTDSTAFDNLPKSERDNTKRETYKRLIEHIKPVKKSPALIVRMYPFLKVASCIILFGVFIVVFRAKLKDVFNIEQYASIKNSSGYITKRILSDGTIIWLKGDSKLDYPVKFKGAIRSVSLEGEALFEVAKDAAHPFIIHCGTLTTRVLGTSFNIRHANNKIEVNVLTGRVFLSSKNTTITLHPYQKAIYSPLKNVIIKVVKPVFDVTALTKGTEYDMLFNDVRVEDVLKRIEKKFGISIAVKDSSISNRLITADFTDQSLKNTIKMMSEALNIDYEINGDAIILKDKHILIN
ncbi:MAG: FecR family protein [Mucilaginibacter sp.]|uniref:FecR family protein n=1 Tax=Mucilaginibacter sp. TaxID=1882438 RepID=UPI002616E3DA|nr:FecR domain-containing protein [Mucilaginibacter sp.]MDB5003281.1 FecR family protein [Mucilaginibacter sp.]